MKKIIINCFTGLLLTWTVASYSQNSNTTAKLKSNSSLDELISSSEEMEKNVPKNSTRVFLSEINSKAIRDFSLDYKNVSDAVWTKSENGFAVYFTNEGIKTRVQYNKRGNRLGVIRDYGEDRMPREIRNLVKSVYYDYSIYLINEVTVDARTGYVVKLQDKTSLIEIKIVDGVMEVMKEYVKSE